MEQLRYTTERSRVRYALRRAREVGRRAELGVHHWLYLLAAWNGRCAYCGRPFETLDHIVPLVSGGGTTKTNVLPCCLECNQQKGTAVWLPASTGAGVMVKW